MNTNNIKSFFQFFVEIVSLVFTVVWKVFLACLKFIYTKRKALRGEIVLLTGASGCMGSLLAEKLSRKGCVLVLVDVSAHVYQLAQKIHQSIENSEVYAYQCDLTKIDDVDMMAADVINKIGHPSIVINNAAIVTGKYFFDTTDEDIFKTFQVNVLCHYRLVRMFLPDMLQKNHGHIVCISSILALQSLAGVMDYGPSKAAATAYMQSLRQEIRQLGKDNVHCTTILPYQVHTDMFKGCSSRFPNLPFLSVLCPDYVTSKMVDAIEKNQVVSYLPRILYIIMILNSFLPVTATDVLHDFLRTNTAMRTWVGRNEKTE